MKSIVLTLTLTVLIFMSFIMPNNKQGYHPSKGEELINSILAKTAKTIKDKYNIRPSGVGVAMPGGPIQEATLCFDTKHPYNKDELRQLLIKSSAELLKQVNENKEIQEFIKEPPFTIKNVQIIIYNHDENGGTLYDPQILTAEISQATLTYRTIESKDNFKLKDEFIETYEDALRIIKE